MNKLQFAIIGAALTSFVVTGHAYASESTKTDPGFNGGFAISIAASPIELSEATPPKEKGFTKTDPLVTGSTGNTDSGGGFAITVMGSQAN